MNTKQYKKATFSLRSLGHLIRISGKETKSEFSEVQKYIREVKKGDYTNLKQLENTVEDLLSKLEEIKKFGRRLNYKEVNKLRELVHLCALNHLFSLIDKNDKDITKYVRDKLHVTVSMVENYIKQEAVDQKRLMRRKKPKGALWKKLLTSDKRISKDEIKEGTLIDHLQNQEDDLYQKATEAIRYIVSKSHDSYPNVHNDLGHLGDLLAKYLATAEREFEHLFNVQLNAEVQEGDLEADLKELEKIENPRVKEVISNLQKKYYSLMKGDFIEVRKMAKEEKKILNDIEKEYDRASA